MGSKSHCLVGSDLIASKTSDSDTLLKQYCGGATEYTESGARLVDDRISEILPEKNLLKSSAVRDVLQAVLLTLPSRSSITLHIWRGSCCKVSILYHPTRMLSVSFLLVCDNSGLSRARSRAEGVKLGRFLVSLESPLFCPLFIEVISIC